MRANTFKIIGYTLLTFIAIIVTVFLCFFVYYTWQFKYGSQNTVQKITKSLEGSFTQIKTDTSTPTFRSDWRSFIRTKNPSLGSTDAPVTILMFIDFECPFSQAGFGVFNEVQATFGSAIRFVFKQFPITSLHPSAEAAAEASICANEQGDFWKFYTAAFQGKKLDESSLYAYAMASGANPAVFDTCFKTHKFSNIITEDLNDGLALGVRGTPTYIVNGRFVEGVLTLNEWKDIILSELNQK